MKQLLLLKSRSLSLFTDPVVVLGTLTHSGGQGVIARTVNVTPEAFEVQMQEFPHYDEYHTTEVLPYLIVDPRSPRSRTGVA